jgi:hypothetical protein
MMFSLPLSVAYNANHREFGGKYTPECTVGAHIPDTIPPGSSKHRIAAHSLEHTETFSGHDYQVTFIPDTGKASSS